MKQIRTGLGTIDVQDLFRSSEDRIAKFAEMQVHLYRQDASLQDYFLALNLNMFYGGGSIPNGQTPINSLVAWSFHAADKASRIRKPRRIKTDVLFCPMAYFGRNTENRLVARTLLGLAHTGAEILCLLPAHAPFRRELELELEAAGRSKQVTFLDPEMPFNQVEARTRKVATHLRARAAFEKTVEILEPQGLSPTRSALAEFEKTANYVELWERLAPFIEFEAIVARCHWNNLCSPVCRTGVQRGKPVITFQQGVVDHTMDVPITASKFVAFGASSASVLAEANRRFFSAVGLPQPTVNYISAGSLFDTVLPLPNQFSLQTVLLIDSQSEAGNPWGTEEQTLALMQLAEKLLAATVPLRRLVIRPHPYWSNFDLEACLKLVREHRDLCELSHPAWSLADDLRRSSVVIGIWSGALTVASASGLPTVFMQTEQGFTTRDLECFSPAQTLLPNAAFREVSRLLADPQSYAEARNVALHNAGEYYAGGANAALDGPFFAHLLGDKPGRKATLQGPQ